MVRVHAHAGTALDHTKIEIPPSAAAQRPRDARAKSEKDKYRMMSLLSAIENKQRNEEKERHFGLLTQESKLTLREGRAVGKVLL